MDWLNKALAVARGVIAKVWAFIKMVVDPPPAAIGWYILAVLAIAIGGNVLFGALFSGSTPASKPYALISPSDVIVSVPPPAPMPVSASPKDLAPLKLLKVKEPAAKKKATGKRKPKPRVSSARSDTRF